MVRIGQAITWSTIAAPHLFTGECTDYSYNDAFTRATDDDEAGDNRALILHSRKAAFSFAAKIKTESTDYMDLSSGPVIAIAGITGGAAVALRASESWRLMQPKTATVSGTHYPDIVVSGTPASPTALTAVTPTAQVLTGFVFPGTNLRYSTVGLTHAAGVVHGLTISQELQFAEDEPSPDGKILGGASHGYLRTNSIDILAKDSKPLPGSVLTLTAGMPTHGAGFRIESSEEKFTHLRGKMYTCNGVWIPGM